MFTRTEFILSIFLSIFLCLTASMAQKKQLTIDDLYDPEKKVDFNGSPPEGVHWLPDGEHYLVPRKKANDKKKKGYQLYKVHAVSGEEKPFFDAQTMIEAFASIPGFPREDAVKLAQRRQYQMNPQCTAVLIKYASDLFHYEFNSDKVVRLTHDPEQELEATYSPDGRMVAFVRNHDLYLVDIAGGQERALTTGGHEQLLNGYLDWVYQEEIYGRGNFKGYWWSPDSSKIAFLQLDEAPVKEFTIVDHLPYRLHLEKLNYPKAGDPNPRVKLGVIDVVGNSPRWIVDHFAEAEILIVRVGWTADGSKVVYQLQDREQTWLELHFADAKTGKSQRIIRETSKAWVEVNGDPFWLQDGSFLWLSERSGWRHIYHYKANGELIRQVTNGQWEVREFHGVDKKVGKAFFSATEHSHIAPQIYNISLTGEELTRLTDRQGTHRSSFNESCTLFIDYWSDICTPTQTYLHDSTGKELRTIEQNKVVELEQYELSKPQFLQVECTDGFVMEALLIKPPDFDESKKYPVLCYTYSGPHAPQVRNAWRGTMLLWHQMLAQKGYLIWICDNRTASGKGAQSAWPVYKNFGELELKDLEAGLAWLKRQPYVDGERIGIWGWSFGGYMTCYALTHSTSFKIGIAGAPVTDWRDYDTIYTERYMARPQNNEEGYARSSVVEAASNLYGRLLLIHGTIDDNVHLQNTIQFIYALQKAGKQFDLMLYPKSRHGVRNPQQVKHLYAMMTQYILDNL